MATTFVEEDGSQPLPCAAAGKKKRSHHLPINGHYEREQNVIVVSECEGIREKERAARAAREIGVE